jgi:hypothetical protein
VIRAGDLSSRDASEHQELLSRLWAKVYALRAEVLLVERLKVWPFDSSEPETSTRKLEVSIRKRDEAVKETRHAIQSYLATYGERISHGDADFNVESLMRLAGWESEE